MAAHVYIDALQALAARLTGLATTAARVHLDRAAPFVAAELPALNIRFEADEVEAQGLGSVRLLSRSMTARVHIVMAGASGVDLLALQVLGEVEAALGADLTLGGAVETLAYTGTEGLQIEDTSEGPLALLPLAITLTLFTQSDAPGVIA